jgi:hypothetical protein
MLMCLVARSVPIGIPSRNPNSEITVGAARQISLTLRTLATLVVGLLVQPQGVEAQIGLTSGMAQVALVARIAPRGSIQGVSAQRETGRVGTMREASVTVRMSANTGYQLVVKGTGASTSRIWVRAANGEFQELTAGSSVTVAQDTHCAGQWEREVRYRIEAQDAAGDLTVLPVRYEIAINPVI